MKFIYLFCSLCCLSANGLFAQSWEALILDNEAWTYTLPSAEPSAAWRNAGFSDTAWLVGNSGFGYGDNDDSTVVPNNTISVYLRKEFNINNAADLTELYLFMDYDDGFVAYFNGVEFARRSLGTIGQLTAWNTLASGNTEAVLYQGQRPVYFRVPNNLIQTGNNVLAIQVHNAAANSSDLSAIPFLIGKLSSPPITYQYPPSWFSPLVDLNTFSTNLPLVVINTPNNANIPDDPKLAATMGIIWNGNGQRNRYNDPFNAYMGNIGIETRGSSSQGFPKKSYGFETMNSANNATQNVSLLGLPAESDWILSANYADKSLMNNVLAYKLFNDFGFYASRTRYVELILNGEYMGVYILMEKIKRDANRVNIANLTPNDNAGDELTGGYILKIDKSTGGSFQAGFYSRFAASSGDSIDIMYSTPNSTDITPAQKTYVQASVDSFERALFTGVLGDTTVPNWRNFANEESFIHYLILNELGRNVDGYRISTYFYKDKNSRDPRWQMGPAWDYDIAWANADYCRATDSAGWAYDFNTYCSSYWMVPAWWTTFAQDSVFMHKLRCRYTNLRQTGKPLHLQSLNTWIDNTANLLNEGQTRNFEKWQILGQYVWPNPSPIPNDYAGEVSELKDWLQRRLNWMDNQLLDTACIVRRPNPPVSVENIPNAPSDFKVYPNPAKNQLNLEAQTPIQQVEIYNNLGQRLYNQVFVQAQPIFVLDNLNQILPQNGIYWIHIQTENTPQKRIFGIMKE